MDIIITFDNILLGKVETPIMRGGQFCCKFTSVSLCQKLLKYNAVLQSYCKN